jgi:hypothetical protein
MTVHSTVSVSKDDLMAKSALAEEGMVRREPLLGETCTARMHEQAWSTCCSPFPTHDIITVVMPPHQGCIGS